MPAPLIPVGVAAAARYLAKNGAKKAIEKYGKTIVTKATQYGKKKVSDEVKAAGERAVEASAVTAAREQELFGMTKIGGKDTKTPNQRIAESGYKTGKAVREKVLGKPKPKPRPKPKPKPKPKPRRRV